METKYQIAVFAILFVAVAGIVAATVAQEVSGSGKDFGQCNAKFNKANHGGGKVKADARKALCKPLKPKPSGNETD